MDYIDSKTKEELILISGIIEKHLSNDNYEAAFIMFLLNTERMNFADLHELIRYFNKYFKNKYKEQK